MKGQQISPWTFLKDNTESQPEKQGKSPLNKLQIRLPKLVKKQQEVKRQDKKTNRANFRSKAYSKHAKTMVLTQMKHIQSEYVTPIKKKTQPLLYEQTQAEQELFAKEDEINHLIDIKSIVKFIRASLQSQKQLQKGKLSYPCLDQIRQKMVSIPQTFQIVNDSVTVRIHDNNIQSKVSMIRSILKKQSQKSHQLKGKKPKHKNSNHILALKLKLTQDEHKIY